MNDTTEMWRDFKQIKQGQRTQRRENAPEILRKHEVFFTEHNHGAHLIIETPMGYVDYWPGTSRHISMLSPYHAQLLKLRWSRNQGV